MELPIATANAVVLQYDGTGGQWRELGAESGLCNINILKSPSNEYRYVAQKNSNSEVVLNAYIFPEMKYDETTPTFHQWYDKSRNAFGLNFPDSSVAKKYAAAVACVLEQLNTPQEAPKPPVAPSVPKFVQPTPAASAKMPIESHSKSNSKVSPYATSTVGATPSQTNTSSTPKTPTVKPSGGGGAPPPPGPPPSAPAPPGPPPAGPSIAKPTKAAGNDFASQLQKAAAQHKAVDIDETLNKPSPVVAEPRPSNPAPAAGGMDFLAEMKMKMNKKASNADGGAPAAPKVPVKAAPLAVPSMSSRPSVVETEATSTTYVTAADLEKFRTDLMNDIIFNIEKMKNEIISSISAKLN